VLYEFGHIGILLIIALIFPLGALVTSWAFKFVNIRPDAAEDPVKTDTYECGMRTEGPTLVQFNFRYYYIALLFVLLDVEIVFLFPWALAYNQLDFFAFGAGLLFIFLLADALIYAWRKNALEWA